MLLCSKGEKLCFKWTSPSQTVPNGKQTGANDKTSERERQREVSDCGKGFTSSW